MASFAGLALLLASNGSYGVISYIATSRTRELAIRAALGADPARVTRLVLGQGLRLTAIGLGVERTMRRIAVVAWLLVFFSPGRVAGQTSPRTHDLKASPSTVHRGFFDASLTPVLTVDPGDIVRLETATGNPRYFEGLGVPKEKIPATCWQAQRWI